MPYTKMFEAKMLPYTKMFWAKSHKKSASEILSSLMLFWGALGNLVLSHYVSHFMEACFECLHLLQ